VLALAGFVAIGVGVHQGLVHVAPGYEGTITSGWGGPLSHEEVLLVQLGAVGVAGALAGTRWRQLSVVPLLTGCLVVGYAVRAVVSLFQSPRPPYREVTIDGAGFGGEAVLFVLGAEPFLLVAGGLLLVGAGVETSRTRLSAGGTDETAPRSSQA
jgi:hypothetical protein